MSVLVAGPAVCMLCCCLLTDYLNLSNLRLLFI